MVNTLNIKMLHATTQITSIKLFKSYIIKNALINPERLSMYYTISKLKKKSLNHDNYTIIQA